MRKVVAGLLDRRWYAVSRRRFGRFRGERDATREAERNEESGNRRGVAVSIAVDVNREAPRYVSGGYQEGGGGELVCPRRARARTSRTIAH